MQQHYPLNPATGLEDPTQLPWINGNPSTGAEGSFPPFALCTEPMDEVVNVIVQAGLTPTSADLTQLYQAIIKLIPLFAPKPAAPPQIPTYSGQQGVKLLNDVVSLDYPHLPGEGITVNDLISFYSEEMEGHAQIGFGAFATAVLAQATSTAVTSGYVAYKVYKVPGSYTFTPDPGCQAIEVIGCWGGGGGGGDGYGYAGAGGGAGGFAAGAYPVTPGTPYSIVVGAGGKGNGVNGGSSFVGAFCGGGGGIAASNDTAGAGGTGYDVDGSQYTLTGAAGTVGTEPGGGNVFVGAGGTGYEGIGNGGSGAGNDDGPVGYPGANGLIIIRQFVG